MITITVTQQDIIDGKRESTCACPIALAANRCIQGAVARVNDDWINISYMSGRFESLALPMEAETFVLCFDTGLPVEPFTFELPIPA